MLHHRSMTTSYNNNMYSIHPGLVSISFYAIPIFPFEFQFFNLLVRNFNSYNLQRLTASLHR